MNIKSKITLYLILTLIALLVTAGLYFTGRLAALTFTEPTPRSFEETIQASSEEFGDFERDWFESLPFQPFSVSSPYGYELQGVYLPGNTDKTIVLCHGYRYTWVGTAKYMPLLMEEGWNIITYNHRYHGDSGGPFCSAGYYESHDLKAVCDWAWRKFPQTETFGVQGESMGGATVLLYMNQDERLDFVWADCPFSDLADLYRDQFIRKNGIPRFLHRPILFFTDRYFKNKYQFELADVSPREEILKSPTPLILFHGMADDFILHEMSEEMYELRKEKAPTKLVLIQEGVHAASITADRKKYEEQLKSFLEEL
ncbi:MAG: alpha/beta fold hydrolase [Spirochaetales bacterium]|nr:alpha/beta fold hydrolase [Spirochaetales bacterium]